MAQLQEVSPMPKFLFEARYSPEGVKGVADKGGTARRDAIQQLFQSCGGTMEAFYFAFGKTDAYVFGELPDNETASAIALNINAAGAAAVRTVVLLDPEQVDQASKATVAYRPPGS
jgi:uncharacterized protein with GYD domain